LSAKSLVVLLKDGIFGVVGSAGAKGAAAGLLPPRGPLFAFGLGAMFAGVAALEEGADEPGPLFVSLIFVIGFLIDGGAAGGGGMPPGGKAGAALKVCMKGPGGAGAIVGGPPALL